MSISVFQSISLLHRNWLCDVLTFFSPSLSVQTGIPHRVLLYLSHLPVWLGQVPSALWLQMVHSSSLLTLFSGALFVDCAKAAAPAALRQPQPYAHSTGLGEERCRGRECESAAHIETKMTYTKQRQKKTQTRWPLDFQRLMVLDVKDPRNCTGKGKRLKLLAVFLWVIFLQLFNFGGGDTMTPCRLIVNTLEIHKYSILSQPNSIPIPVFGNFTNVHPDGWHSLKHQ